MKKYSLVFATVILLNASPSGAESFCQHLQTCATENISKLDDGISSTSIIAKAITSVCTQETQQCILSMQESAIKRIPDKLKEDGTHDQVSAYDIGEIEKSIRSEKNVNQFRETITNDLLIPMILKGRVSKAQN